MSGPDKATNSTASQITMIANAVPTSRTSSRVAQ